MKTLKIKPDSEAEEYFVKELMPICKDKVSCLLGVFTGNNYNQYSISNRDYFRIRKAIKAKKGVEL